jgi:dynactin-6
MSSSRKPPPAPKPPTSLSPTVTISDAASLTGIQLIKIGDGSVIHPRAKLISAYGPVTIGNTSIISERASIGLLAASENQHEGVMIGDGVVIEVGAVVQARKVGSGCLIEINAKIGRGAVIGKVSCFYIQIYPHSLTWIKALQDRTSMHRGQR